MHAPLPRRRCFRTAIRKACDEPRRIRRRWFVSLGFLREVGAEVPLCPSRIASRCDEMLGRTAVWRQIVWHPAGRIRQEPVECAFAGAISVYPRQNCGSLHTAAVQVQRLLRRGFGGARVGVRRSQVELRQRNPRPVARRQRLRCLPQQGFGLRRRSVRATSRALARKPSGASTAAIRSAVEAAFRGSPPAMVGAIR